MVLNRRKNGSEKEVVLKKPGRKPGRPKSGGRKKGTPNKVTKDAKRLANGYGKEAIKILVDIMRDGSSDQVRVSAAREVLDRAYGKAPQAIQHSGEAGGPITFKVVYDA